MAIMVLVVIFWAFGVLTGAIWMSAWNEARKLPTTLELETTLPTREAA